MDPVLIAAAIPFFFVAMGLELAVNVRRGESGYRLADSITNLSCGIGQQILEVFFKALGLWVYGLVWQHARIATVPSDAVLSWVALLLGVDLSYYWFHRASHRVNVLWATHVVHHQSEEYNLSVALRQSWFYTLFDWVFYVPLAVAGFPLWMFVVMKTVNILYQFWIHTRAVGKLGPLEWVLNTPSHHRVHHGIDPQYVDRNYGGIFIVWDRLFGTFQGEEGEPVYGVVKPLRSWNPLWANVQGWVELARLSRSAGGWDAVRVWWMPPDWRPARLGGRVKIPAVSRATQRKYDEGRGSEWGVYVLVGFGLVTAATAVLIVTQGRAPVAAMVAGSAALLVSLVSWGALLERRTWALPLELGRLAGAAALGLWLLHGTRWWTGGVAVVAVVSVCMAGWALLAGGWRPFSRPGKPLA